MSVDDSTNHAAPSLATIPDPVTGPRQTHVELSFGELVRRMGAEPPHIYLVDDMQRGRVVWEAFEAPGVRRITAYAMHPETYDRAMNAAMETWGPSVKGIEGAQPPRAVVRGGRAVIIPVHKRLAFDVTDPNDEAAIESPFWAWEIQL